MPKIPQTVQFESKWNLPKFATAMQRIWQQMAQIINGLLSFGNSTAGSYNISGAWVSMNSGAGNVDVTLTHNLGRIPAGYLVMSKTAACDVYTGSVAATTTQITLRGSVGGVTVELFIV